MKNFKNSKAVKIATGLLGLALSAMMIAPAIASADTTSACSYVFTKTLKVGVTDQEVWNLQKVLNMNAATQVAASGAGSPGMESKYFGAKTKAAVIKWQNMNAAAVLTPAGLTAGTGLVGAMSRAKLNMMCSGGSTTTTTGTGTGTGTTSTVPGCTTTSGYSPLTGAPCGSMTTTTSGTGAVSVALDAASPMSGSIIDKQALANLGMFKLTNTGSTASKVTMVQFKRTGVSSDATLRNVYLYNDYKRLTDSASVASGVVSFNDANGVVTIPAGGSLVVTVKADLDTTTHMGETVGMMLTGLTADGVAVGGLPISAAMQSVAAQPAGMTTADFSTSVTPTTNNIDPQNDAVMWQDQLTIGSRDALLQSIAFQQIGSVYPTEIGNFRLMIDGVQVGSAVASVDSNRYVTFSFPTPITVRSGSRTVKVLGDIIGGSSRTFQLSLRRVGDLSIMDSQLMVPVAATKANASFTPIDAGTMTVSSGQLTVTKTTDSPSGNVVYQGSQVTLAKYNVKATGENMKVENLFVSWTGTSSTSKLRNGALFLNGVQVGSTQDILGSGTTFNLGSSMVVMPGKDATLEVRADVYNTVTANGQFMAGDSITVSVGANAVSNTLRQTSLSYIIAPAAPVAGNTLSVQSGNLVLSKYTAYANQTVVVPQSAYKLAEFRLTTGSTEAVNLSNLGVDFTGSTVAASSFSSIYVVYGPVGGTMKTSQIRSTIANVATQQSFSTGEVVPTNANYVFAVYGTLDANATGAVVTRLQVTGTGQNSGGSTDSGVVTGQTVTVGTGSIIVANDASAPVAAMVVGNTMPKIGSFKFTATNDSFTIDELTLKVGSAASAAAIANYTLKDGATSIKDQPLSGSYATATGLSILVPANGSKVIDVYANLGGIGTGYASTSMNLASVLNAFEYISSTGSKVRTYGNASFGATTTNAFYAYKTKPTIANVALPTTVLTAGTQTIYQFSVTADAGGTVAWRQIKFNIATTTATAASFTLYDASNQSSALANTTCTLLGSTVTCVSTTDQEVSGSKTYVLKATLSGVGGAGSAVSVNIPTGVGSFAAATDSASVSANSSFTWSDESSQPHSGTTQDWNNDFLVKNIPTDSETMSK